MLDYPIIAAMATFRSELSAEQGHKLLAQAVRQLPDPTILLGLARSSGGSRLEDIMQTNNYGVSIHSHEYMSIFPKISVSDLSLSVCSS